MHENIFSKIQHNIWIKFFYFWFLTSTLFSCCTPSHSKPFLPTTLHTLHLLYPPLHILHFCTLCTSTFYTTVPSAHPHTPHLPYPLCPPVFHSFIRIFGITHLFHLLYPLTLYSTIYVYFVNLFNKFMGLMVQHVPACLAHGKIHHLILSRLDKILENLTFHWIFDDEMKRKSYCILSHNLTQNKFLLVFFLSV